jgi:hypothetical protein
MTSKTARSGRVDFLLRMQPKLKERIIKAANQDGVSVTDWLLDGIEHLLAVHDTEVAADKKRADIERRLEMKFQEIVASLACGDLTSLSTDRVLELHEVAEAAIKKWRDHTATDYYAEPKTPIERLCKDLDDLETELEGARRISTFEDDDEALLDEALFAGHHDDDDLDDAESE